MDTMNFMPRTQARIFDQGVSFSNGFVTTPLCCPSRASILTGLYAHDTGVHINSDQLTQPTFVESLHANGYLTGIVGKYLNSWEGSKRPEFDYWASFEGGKSPYQNPVLNIQGTWITPTGYMTYLLRDYALEFLKQSAQQSKPFMLLFTPNAPHHPYDPAPGDENLYPDLKIDWPPNYNEADVSDKPKWVQGFPLITPKNQLGDYDIRRRQAQMLWSLDQAINSLLDQLQQQGQLDNTLILYINDNGLLVGEHRLAGKAGAYEEDVHVPFGIRYPPLIPTPRVENRIVANIDIAPTIYELAGLPIPSNVDGRSLLPLLKGQSAWRDDILLEGWVEGPAQVTFQAARTERYVYIENQGDLSELYDLQQDPYELSNLINDPAHAPIITDMQARLKRLLSH